MMKVKIDAFEGPLDLLLHLIGKAEVDIYEISVSEITDQYVAYIEEMQELELEVASEYLVMAATLVALKSNMLLPKKEEMEVELEYTDELQDIDTREQLIQRLIEYKAYKQVSLLLRDLEVERSKLYTRPAESLQSFIEQDEVNPVEHLSLFDLLSAYQNVFLKNKDAPIRKVVQDEVSIDKRMRQIATILTYHQRVLFLDLFQESYTREQVVVTFLAVLEMIKKKEIGCTQERVFADIWIFRYEGEKVDGS